MVKMEVKLTKVVLALLLVCYWVRNSHESITRACVVRNQCGSFRLPLNVKGSRHKRFLSKPTTRTCLSVDLTGPNVRVFLLLLLLSGDVEQNPGPVNDRKDIDPKKKKEDECICPICEVTIIDKTSDKDGQDSIFCEGQCQAWIHKQCASLSNNAFKAVAKSRDPSTVLTVALIVRARRLLH